MHTDLSNEISLDLIGFLLEELMKPTSQLVMIEMRHQGNALGRQPAVPSAVGVRPTGFWFNAVAMMPPDGREAAQSQMTARRSAMGKWATGSVCLNGIDESGADRVRRAYSPETWRRLTEIKQKYDPQNTFRLNRNIGPA